MLSNTDGITFYPYAKGKKDVAANMGIFRSIIVPNVRADYIDKVLKTANFIIITRDDLSGETGSPRGFAICTVTEQKMTVDLIGNKRPPVTTRSKRPLQRHNSKK